MSQNPNDPNNQKKSNPLKDATSHFIKKKGCRQAGKWQKWQEKQEERQRKLLPNC
ncbi:hypothetical protein [Bacillus paranthracis]|uniref:hypothetical protein n=1 Tax=Bacillus paranthracis TaxID=2026186 RepID=UPI0013D670EB|nr:hypothetical protein JQJ56_19685 [Bacillus paranthracis]